jgi:hypothetical protein
MLKDATFAVYTTTPFYNMFTKAAILNLISSKLNKKLSFNGSG